MANLGGLQYGAFNLVAGVLDGTWALQAADGTFHNFSDAALYGHASAVPVPGAVWLFGSALAGAAGVGRWRRKRKAAGAT